MKLTPARMLEEAVDGRSPSPTGDDVRVRVARREGRVEGPARVDPAMEERPEREEGPML